MNNIFLSATLHHLRVYVCTRAVANSRTMHGICTIVVGILSHEREQLFLGPPMIDSRRFGQYFNVQ